MYKKQSSFITALLLASSFDAGALQVTRSPEANDDHISTVIGVYTSAEGDVSTNDRFGDRFTLDTSWVGKYGAITEFDSEGEYTYKLFKSTTNASLPSGEAGIDSFTYTYHNDTGLTDTAQLIIDVNADPNASDGSGSGSSSPIARDDNNTIIQNKITEVTGNVTANDSNGNYVQLISSPSSDYGVIVLQSDGSYIYGLYPTSPKVIELKAGEVVTDEFDYQYLANSGESATAKLTVQIIGNPVDSNGDTIFEQPDDEPYDNVDIEFNNRSTQATSLNSGRNIRGHLYHSGDKDWYSLASAGDEVITLEVCPKGTSCFDKKSWVLYVFDSDLLTKEMEEKTYQFSRWLDESGTTFDESEDEIISGNAGKSNHMYLAYRAGFFEGALIGVVDPCFDTLNSVDIGVDGGARNYLIAISSPLKGDSGDAESCGVGSVVLQEPGRSALGSEAPTTIKDEEGNEIEVDGKVKTYTTTEEGIIVFPNSDDQYAIKITGTGINPLLSDDAEAKSSTFNWDTGELSIPRVRIANEVFQANLVQRSRKSRSADNTLEFILSDIQELDVDELVDAYRATYNPDNQQVLIPRVTDTTNDKAYSVILQYHTASNDNQAWLEVLSVEEIQ